LWPGDGSCHPFPVAPNLLDRQLAATTKPNQVWPALARACHISCDIT